MRILLVNDPSVPHGGSEIYCLRLRKALRERGHNAALASCRLGPSDQREADFQYPDGRGETRLSRTLADFYNRQALRGFREILEQFRPDVVDLHLFGHLSLAILPRLAHIPTVYTAPDYFLSCPTNHRMLSEGLICPYVQGWQCVANNCRPLAALPFIWLRRYLIQRYQHHIDLAIGPSSAVAEDLRKTGLSRVERLFHGIPLEERRQRDPQPNILFVGRLAREKGVDVLLRAMYQVRQVHPELRLIIVGDGSLRPSLERMAAELEMSNYVDFLGWVLNADLPELHSHTRAMVLPSICPEAFGMVTIEAQAWGTPVIGTNIGGTTDLICHGETGLLCRPNDATDLAEQICYILEHPRQAERMAVQAREFVEENCSMDMHVNQLLQLYESVIE